MGTDMVQHHFNRLARLVQRATDGNPINVSRLNHEELLKRACEIAEAYYMKPHQHAQPAHSAPPPPPPLTAAAINSYSNYHTRTAAASFYINQMSNVATVASSANNAVEYQVGI